MRLGSAFLLGCLTGGGQALLIERLYAFVIEEFGCVRNGGPGWGLWLLCATFAAFDLRGLTTRLLLGL
jgi:hypothetical protein